MILKEEYKNVILTRRVGGKLITFDPNNADYEWYYNNGFSDCFINNVGVIKFKNDGDTPIIKKKSKYNTTGSDNILPSDI